MLAQSVSKAEAEKLFQQGIEQYRNSQYQAALQTWQQALSAYQALNDRQGEGATLGNLGIAYRSTGAYLKALEHQQKCLAIMRELKNVQGEGQTLANLANVYESLGNYPKAIELQRQSLAIAETINNRRGMASALSNLGALHATIEKNNEASQYYQKALEIARTVGDRLVEANTLNNLGALVHTKRQFEQAVQYYQQSLAIAQASKMLSTEGIALGGLGLAYESLKDYDKALEYHQKSVAIAKEIGNKREEALSLNNLGHTLLVSGKPQQAEGYLRNALQVLDALRSGLSDREKVSIFDTQVLTYNLLQQVLIAQNKPEAVLEISEWGRARAFVDVLAARVSEQSQRQLAVAPPNIQQIQAIAKAQNATLVEYSIIPDEFLAQGRQRGTELELYIWVVQPTGRIFFRKADLRPLLQQNSSLKALVTNTREYIDGVPGATGKEGLKQLHQLLIQPITELLPQKNSDRIIFIPHEILFLVPFTALQDASGQYLIENHTILSAPAIQVLELTHQQRQKTRAIAQNALIVGNPVMPMRGGQPLISLPGAEQEATAIASLFKTQAIIGNQATKAYVEQQMPTARIVHLATHGFFDGGGELGVPGEIALTPSGGDNGWLTAGEILQMKLNAELVVLSACNTGRGEITGDGVVGLSRSLISAGVPSVIVSLWEVPDDPTALLMKEFYRHFLQSTEKAQALRQAMLATKQQYPEPGNWAAFTLIGEAQ